MCTHLQYSYSNQIYLNLLNKSTEDASSKIDLLHNLYYNKRDFEINFLLIES